MDECIFIKTHPWKCKAYNSEEWSGYKLLPDEFIEKYCKNPDGHTACEFHKLYQSQIDHIDNR